MAERESPVCAVEVQSHSAAPARHESQPSSGQLARHSLLPVIFALAFIGFVLILVCYWPGIMIDDSRWQYQQVVDNAYEDWHPPLMAWIWRHLVFLAPGPAPMLVLEALLYWGGISLIATALYKAKKPRLALAITCAGFLPAPLALTGTIIKDALTNGMLLVASGMLLWRPLVRTMWARSALAFSTLIALLAAAALRYNAFFACVPLALVALPRPLTRTWARMFLSALAAAAALLAVGPAVASLVHAEDTDVQLSLMIFDLGGITEHTGVSQFPQMHVRDPVAVNHGCYDPYEWDSYSDWASRPCPLGFDAMQALVDDGDVNPRMLWLRAIGSHPIAYLEHRAIHFNLSSSFLTPNGPDFTAWSQSVANPWGFRILHDDLSEKVSAIADFASLTPFGWPIFWISLALAMFVAGVANRLPQEPLAIAASAFLYGAGYFFVGVATGIRYYMWTFSGAAIAALIIGSELWRRRSQLRRWSLVLSLSMLLIPTLLAAAARLLPT